MAFTISLPAINGEIEAGITVGIDSSLPDADKLPIITQANMFAPVAAQKANAAVWAYGKTQDQTARKILVNGVLGILDLGLVCSSGGVADGDWIKSVNIQQADDATRAGIERIVNIEEMKKAVTVAIATKANWWVMNHHTGQGQPQGYTKKVLEAFYKDNVSEAVVTAAHSLGHFTSTLKVLGLAGITGLRQVDPVTYTEGASLALSQDAKLRFSSMPAGTHRLAVAFEAAKRLIRSAYVAYCPGVNEFVSLPEQRALVMRYPASYHIGASYLTGAARAAYTDTDYEALLGRLGTFITTLYKASTLAKSPHLAESKVVSYEDYDADFKATLVRIQHAQAAARGKLAEGMESEATSPEVVRQLRDAFTARLN